MSNSTQRSYKLFQIATLQDGFFTTKQAISAGYQSNYHPYHVKTGNWIREYRGIYRLANYPTGDRPDLMLWYLWSKNRKEEPQGVYSHETSLALYELSDVNPDKLHMTVPISFRRNSQIPNVLVIHYRNIALEETDQIYGVRATKPIRTMNDLINDGTLSDDLLKQAMTEAIGKGMVTKREIEKYKQNNFMFEAFINKAKI